MTNDLETRLERFRLGKKIINDMVEDLIRLHHKQEPHYGAKIHETRVDGLRPGRDQWELMGYLYGLAVNIVKHPKLIYDALKKREDEEY